MAIAANITAPNITQSGDFNVRIAFAEPVTDFTDTDISVVAAANPIDSGDNGITGVTWILGGSGGSYYIQIKLPVNLDGSPAEKYGSMDISITGQVMVNGESQPQSVTASAVTVKYDTRPGVVEICGDTEYRADGTVIQPITFDENVVVTSKSVFDLYRVSGDELDGIVWYLVGEGKDFEIVFEMPTGRYGSFLVRPVGKAFKQTTEAWVPIKGDPKLVVYNTL